MVEQRRLAAILAADVVGFSRLAGADEERTLARLRALRSDLIDPTIALHRGRVVKRMGDGILVEFASVVDALRTALDIQAAMQERNSGLDGAKRLDLRIGIHLGDVVVEADGDLMGDGVNIAARLEGLAEPAGICLSEDAHRQVQRKVEAAFEEAGEQKLKNMDQPIRVYRVKSGGALPKSGPDLSLPERPSIVVLPFDSMSKDAEHEAFADGLTEDLITDLSRNAGLFVIARNSAYAYKGRSLDVRQIARELGVRYLLEGSARRAADRVRINVQLIDAVGGGHLWADRFDRDLKDVFAIQDEVTAKIVEALVGRLTKPLPRYRPKNMKAYDLCVRARVLCEESPQAAREAQLLLRQAIALDPDYAEPHRRLALTYWLGWAHWGEPEDPLRRLGLEEAQKAVALDPSDGSNHMMLGYLWAHERRWEEAEAAFALALKLDPNDADAWGYLSDLRVMAGQVGEAEEQIGKALRLNPLPDVWYWMVLGQVQYAKKDYEAAIATLRRPEIYRTMSRRILAASLAQLGKLEEARQEAALFMLTSPHFTIAHWLSTQPIRSEEIAQHFCEGYRLAGLPE